MTPFIQAIETSTSTDYYFTSEAIDVLNTAGLIYSTFNGLILAFLVALFVLKIFKR